MRKLHLSDVRALSQSLSKFWILNINVWYILLYNLNHHFWITFCTSAWALSKGVEFSKTFGSPWPITPPSMDDLNTRFAELPKKQSVIIVLQTNDQSNTGCPIWMEWLWKSYCGFIFGARQFSTIKNDGGNAWHPKWSHSSSLKFIPSVWDTLYNVNK